MIRQSAPKADALPGCAIPRRSIPNVAVRYHATGRAGKRKPTASRRPCAAIWPPHPSALEQRVLDLVSRLDAELLADAAIDLQHRQNRPPDGIVRVESGSVRSAMRAIVPSARMNSMSREM